MEKRAAAPYHHGHLRQALIETSLEVIAESGVRALTLREIAVRLNVSRMAPYRHFADKAALLAAITTAGFIKFADALEAAWASAPGQFEKQADALAVSYVRFARENRSHFEVMFGGGGEPQYLNEEGGAVAHRSFQVLENMVREGQHLGEIVEGDATEIARMIWATVHGISTLGLDPKKEKRRPWEAEFTNYCSRMLRMGLRPRA